MPIFLSLSKLASSESSAMMVVKGRGGNVEIPGIQVLDHILVFFSIPQCFLLRYLVPAVPEPSWKSPSLLASHNLPPLQT